MANSEKNKKQDGEMSPDTNQYQDDASQEPRGQKGGKADETLSEDTDTGASSDFFDLEE